MSGITKTFQMQPMCKPKAWIFHHFTSYESMRHILKQSLSMAVKRKGEWNHASEREAWVFVGLRFWLEAAPLYWTTTSFPFKYNLFFFPELKKICMWPGYFSSVWLWRKLISVQCQRWTLARGCLFILPVVEQSSNS